MGNKKKKIFLSLIPAVLLIIACLWPANSFVQAVPDTGTVVGNVMSWIMGMIVNGLGKLLTLIMGALVKVSQYSNFINAPAIKNGWVVVRDVCNMFFVLILLIIAFATILNVEAYNYKKNLPKLIAMAILINFSKTICGLLIDVAQVVMMTFVNAYKGIAAGNLVTNLGITEIISISAASEEGANMWAIAVAYILAIVYLLITIVVTVTMLAILVMRIVMIWIYVVLSPAAYLLGSFPGGKQYSSKWWTDFTKNLIVGPILAFFLWLSFASLQEQDFAKDFAIAAAESRKGISSADTEMVFMRFVVSIGMLIGGLQIAQSVGGTAGSMAGKGLAKINKGTAFVTGAASGFALAKAKATGKWAGRTSLGLASSGLKGAGTALQKIPANNATSRLANQAGRGLSQVGGIGASWKQNLVDSNEKAKMEKRKKFLEKMGVKADTADQFNQTFGGKNRIAQNMANQPALIAGGAVLGTMAGLGPIIGSMLASGLGFGFSKLGQIKDQKIRDAEADVAGKEANYNATLAAAGGNMNDPSVVGAKEELTKSRNNLNTYKGIGGSPKAMFWDSVESAASFSTKYTSKAAKKIADVEEKARTQVSGISKDPTWMDDASGNAFYSSNGQQEDQAALIRHLSNDTPEAAAARSNIENWIRTEYDGNNKHDVNLLRALAKGIAATNKKGIVDTSSLGNVTSAINSKSADIGNTVSGFGSSVIAYRRTGTQGEAGTGGMYVDSFAGDKEGHDVLAADFGQLEAAGVKIDSKAEGAYVSQENMRPIAAALVSQLEGEIKTLEGRHEAGTIDEAEYTKQRGQLDRAKEKLSNPETLGDFKMINTTSANFGRQARLATKYHEDMHGVGLQDEELSENIAGSLINNKLYGRNAATGGRHAAEVGRMAKEMKDRGMSNSQIMATVDKEIKNRVAAEGASRAERVVRMENGQKETVSQDIKEGNPEEQASIDIKPLEDKLASLEKTFRAFKVPDNSVQMSSLFNSLFQLMRRGNESQRKVLQKIVDADATPLELGAFNDVLKK